MFEYFRRDLDRYWTLDSADGRPGIVEKLRIMLHAPQIQSIAVYRFGNWVHRNVKAKAARLPLKIAYHLLEKTTQALWGIHIDEGADIGPGFYIGHPGDLFIGPVKMGEDCNISAHARMGRRTDGRGGGGAPTLGDRVYVGVGAILFGPIHVGSGATIGPLTVVGRNVAPRSMVSGNPMQVLRKDWDNTQQIYGAMPPVIDEPTTPGDPPVSGTTRKAA